MLCVYYSCYALNIMACMCGWETMLGDIIIDVSCVSYLRQLALDVRVIGTIQIDMHVPCSIIHSTLELYICTV